MFAVNCQMKKTVKGEEKYQSIRMWIAGPWGDTKTYYQVMAIMKKDFPDWYLVGYAQPKRTANKYKRNFPDSSYHIIVTKKAKFFGQLMYAVLVAGGAPCWFRYDSLRDQSIETLLDSLLSNSVNFKVTYDGPRNTTYTPYKDIRRQNAKT